MESQPGPLERTPSLFRSQQVWWNFFLSIPREGPRNNSLAVFPEASSLLSAFSYSDLQETKNWIEL
jgi:hypothetical protein